MGATTFYLLEQERLQREKDKSKEVVNDGKKQSEKVNAEGYATETKQENTGQEEKTLDDYTVSELKEIAKNKEIENYSTMKKAELIEALGE